MEAMTPDQANAIIMKWRGWTGKHEFEIAKPWCKWCGLSHTVWQEREGQCDSGIDYTTGFDDLSAAEREVYGDSWDLEISRSPSEYAVELVGHPESVSYGSTELTTRTFCLAKVIKQEEK